MTRFDPTVAREHVSRVWDLPSEFGCERSANHVYLNEIVSDRYQLISGLQVVRDELQFADRKTQSDVFACGADFSAPSVVTTVAHTTCGDRINEDASRAYTATVASRFSTMSEVGSLKTESFAPTGGGTDDGATLAHVTVAHQLDDSLRKRIYEGNPQSYALVAFDVSTHVGRADDDVLSFGLTREAPWREPRAACGAILGTLASFNPENGVHKRIRTDLGEDNYQFLREQRVHTADGIDITAAVAAAIVCIQGLTNTARACINELDERAIAHLTATTVVNRTSQCDPLIYLARATVFGGTIRYQGLGTDARKYSGRLVTRDSDRRIELRYDGLPTEGVPVTEQRFGLPLSIRPVSLYD